MNIMHIHMLKFSIEQLIVSKYQSSQVRARPQHLCNIEHVRRAQNMTMNSGI